MTNICLSGGADGADLQWGMCAGKRGDSVIHWGFEGHRSKAPEIEIYLLTQDQLKEANKPCRRAAKSLQRYFPPRSPYTRDLLRRNWFQVKDAESVYAVSIIDDDDKVKGGTAWAVQMFIDRFNGYACPAYVFDQVEEVWYEWKGLWVPLDGDPPAPEGCWAGIGTRDLLPAGKVAIRRLMDYVV